MKSAYTIILCTGEQPFAPAWNNNSSSGLDITTPEKVTLRESNGNIVISDRSAPKKLGDRTSLQWQLNRKGCPILSTGHFDRALKVFHQFFDDR